MSHKWAINFWKGERGKFSILRVVDAGDWVPKAHSQEMMVNMPIGSGNIKEIRRLIDAGL